MATPVLNASLAVLPGQHQTPATVPPACTSPRTSTWTSLIVIPVLGRRLQRVGKAVYRRGQLVGQPLRELGKVALPARQNTPAEIARSPTGGSGVRRVETAARGLREPRRDRCLAGSRIAAQQESTWGTGQEAADPREHPFPSDECARALLEEFPV